MTGQEILNRIAIRTGSTIEVRYIPNTNPIRAGEPIQHSVFFNTGDGVVKALSSGVSTIQEQYDDILMQLATLGVEKLK